MKKVLRYLSLWLLVMAAIPAFGQINKDEIVIKERDFEQKSQFSATIAPDAYSSDRNDSLVWKYSDKYGCAIAKNETDTVYYRGYVSLSVPLADPNYYDFKLYVSYAGVHLKTDTDLKIQVINHMGDGLVTKYIPIEISEELQDSCVLVEKVFSLDSLDLSMSRRATINFIAEYLRPDQGEWHIHNVKFTAKHRYGKGNTPTEITSLSDLKNLSDSTYVKLKLSSAILLYSDTTKICLSDNSGSTLIWNNNGSVYGYSSYDLYNMENMDVSNCEIHGVYTTYNGYPHIDYPKIVSLSPEYRYKIPTAKEISAENYVDNIGNYISMTCQDVDVRYKYQVISDDWMTQYTAEETLHIPYQVKMTGYAVPLVNGNVGFLMSEQWGSVEYVVPDDYDVDLGFFKNIPRVYYNIKRHFDAGKWYTIIIPAFMSYRLMNCTLAKFVSSSNGEIQFEIISDKNNCSQNIPYLIKFDEDTDSIRGSGYSVKTDIKKVEGTEYNFVGTYKTVQPSDGSYYLSANNTIRPLAPGGTIKAFRAYFEPATPSAAPARAISIDGVVTSVNDIEIDGLFPNNSNAPVYNLNGQRVNDSSKKGLYIQNGKKIIR